MSDAKQCDRCGYFYKPKAFDGRSYVPDVSGYFNEIELINRNLNGCAESSINYDLCPECRLEFRRWFCEPQGDDDEQRPC